MSEQYKYLGFTFVEGRTIDSGRVEYEVYHGLDHVATVVRDERDPDGAPDWGIRESRDRITWYSSRLALITYLRETL